MRSIRNAAALRLLPVLLAVSLVGCASRLPPAPPPVQPPRLLPPPADLMDPIQPASWSESARNSLQRWQKLLTPAEHD